VATVITTTLDRQGAPTYQKTTVGSNTFYHWWEYDNLGRLDKTYASTSSSKPGTADVTYTYTQPGQIASVKYLSGTAVPYDYNSRDWLLQIGNPASSTYPFSATYTYLTNGRIDETHFYNKQSPATYDRYRIAHEFDFMGRLRDADYSYYNSGWQTTAAYDLTDIDYDPSGNLLAMKRYRSAGTLIDNLTYQYTSGTNRLNYTDDAVSTTGESWDAEDGSSGAFTYDANGAMTALPAPYSVTSVTYDPRGMATKVVASGNTTYYRYNVSAR